MNKEQNIWNQNQFSSVVVMHDTLTRTEGRTAVSWQRYRTTAVMSGNVRASDVWTADLVICTSAVHTPVEGRRENSTIIVMFPWVLTPWMLEQ